NDARWRCHARVGLLPWPLRLRTRCAAGWRSDRPPRCRCYRRDRRRGAQMTTTIYIPKDAAALALGAEKVAKAVAAEIATRGLDAKIVRNGSRGMVWLETLVEVATAAGRVAYGPVKAADVASLFDAGFLSGGAHRLSLGNVEDLPFFAKQTRLTFARCGIVDPLSLDDYRAHGGLRGLTHAVAATPAEIVQTVPDS